MPSVRHTISAALLSAVLAAPGLAQEKAAPSLLEQTKQQLTIAAQKVEADVRLSLREATRLEKSEPAAAIAKLKAGLAIVENTVELADGRKASLARIIRDRLRVTEAGPESAEVIAARDKAAADQLAAIKTANEAAVAEGKAVKAGLVEAYKLRKEGKTADGEKLVAELTKKYPGNIAVLLVNGMTGFEANLKANDQVKKDTEKGFVSALNDVGRSAIPISGDIEFPKDWKERTKNRRDSSAPTEQERKMITTLERPIPARYKDSRFQDAMEHLSELMNTAIHMDAATLAEAGVTYDTLVNFSAREPLSARVTLRTILAQFNLTFVVRDNVIFVTTPAKARELMITKVYYLGDLMAGLGPIGGTPQVGPYLDHVQTINNVTAIVEMVKGAVDPGSWEGKGGTGTVGVHLPTLSLIVRQSQEVHAMLRGTLYGSGLKQGSPVPKQ